MRFIASVWLLILAPLLVFTFALFSHESLTRDLSPFALKFALVATAWIVGLVSAGSIHILFQRTERIVQKAARDETIIQMAGAVAHEMNQPLTVLISSGELICHHDYGQEEIRTVAGRMVEASLRMADIVEKLQKATHYQSKHYVGDLKIVDLDKAV